MRQKNRPPVTRGTGFSRPEDPAAAPSGFGGKIDRTEADRKEAGALAAKLRLGEATEQDFEAYLEDIKNRYGYVPTAGSQEEMLDEVQSYLRSQQPKAKNFAEQRAEGTDPLSRIGNTVTGAAKQFAGGFSEAVANVAQNVGTAQIMNHFTGSTTPADPFLTALTRPLDQKIAQAGRATADKLMESGAADIAKAQKGLNPAGRLLVNAGVGVTQMAGDAAIGIATGGGAMLPMMVRSFGNGAQEARQKGYSEEQQMALGLANAATEFLSEKLFGGNPVYDRDAGLINKLVGKIVKNPKVMEVLASTPVDMLTEGLEEIASDILNPVAEWAITGNRPEYELDQIIEDGAVGVLTAMVANGGAKVVNTIAGGQKAATEKEVTQSDLLLRDMLGRDKAPAQTEVLVEKSSSQMGTSDGIMAEIRNSIKEDRIHGEERKETRAAFTQRSISEGLTVRCSEAEGDGRAAAYGYRDIFPQGCTGEVRRRLNKFGISSFAMDGTLWQNQDGISKLYKISDAVTVPGVGVFVNAETKIPPMQIVGHEVYHYWKGTVAREAYIEVLQDNLDYASKAFRDYQDSFERFYFDDEVDIFDAKQRALFQEELFAYISGDLHEGTRDAQLAPMFWDFDAVKAAWETLVRENQKG